MKMDQIQLINTNVPPMSLGEIPQTSSMKFALYHKEDAFGKQIHPFIKCKDYFHEVLYGAETNTFQKIWGFYWDPKQMKFDTDKLRMFIKIPKKEEADNFLKNFEKFNEWEAKVGMTPATLFSTQDKDTFALEADARWQQRNFLMSMYTLLLRSLGCPLPSFNDEGYLNFMKSDANSCDRSNFLLLDQKKKFHKMMNNPLHFFKEEHGVIGEAPQYKGKLTSGKIHDYGIVAFMTDQSLYHHYIPLRNDLMAA